MSMERLKEKGNMVILYVADTYFALISCTHVLASSSK